MAYSIHCKDDRRVVTMVVPGDEDEARFVLMEMLRTSESLRDYDLRSFEIKECGAPILDPGGFLIGPNVITEVTAGGFTFRSYTSKLDYVPVMLERAKERVLGYLRVGGAYVHVFVPVTLKDELVKAFRAVSEPMSESVAEVKKLYDF